MFDVGKYSMVLTKAERFSLSCTLSTVDPTPTPNPYAYFAWIWNEALIFLSNKDKLYIAFYINYKITRQARRKDVT